MTIRQGEYIIRVIRLDFETDTFSRGCSAVDRCLKETPKGVAPLP